MYSEIQQLKSEGLNKSQTARRLRLDIKTIIKYWDIDTQEFAEMSQKSWRRSSKLDKYQAQILARLKEYPDLSAAQIQDWLKELYPLSCFRERTVRRYVAALRKAHGLQKCIAYRQCEAVDELPPGQQMQVDFGEIIVPASGGHKRKVYCMATVLAHSRFKYAEWSDQPFTTPRLTAMLQRCFEYIGGMPQELVFDQDKLVAVSENHGDILYTEEFERLKQALRFKVYLCRKSDPESKGKVEAAVKYVKYNFAKHRLFTTLQDWNKAQLDWLERTGNAKEHGTTKKVPAKVHALEKQHLQPIPLIKLPEDILSATVRKDNTILYKGNRYSLPPGTYQPGRKIRLDLQEETLSLFDSQTDLPLAQHHLSQGRGLLIKSSNHRRDNTVVIDKLQEITMGKLGQTASAEQFLTSIRKEKRRYARDQFQLLASVAETYSAEIVQKAMNECLHLKLISAVSCRDIAQFLFQTSSTPLPGQLIKSSLPSNSITPMIQTEHRQLAAYSNLYGGISQ
jgi:transposase